MEWHLPDRCLHQFGREQCIHWRSPDSQRAFHGRDGRQVTCDWPRSWRNSSRFGRTDNPRILSLQLKWVEWGIMTHTWIDIGKHRFVT
ncbi:unnamed protein product [Linum tenue]|uniref:Uncharacterized protein n=1 Tax=Linum tenue TaxID=586396 RepID=A0AAV0NFZ1_9ROSI|nr:unnamed protein product [Linum tenue]